MNFYEKRILGRTGLKVGRLGIASGYGAPSEAIEEAFEQGCNYFTWGTFIKGRMPEMEKAVIDIVKKGQRDNLVLSLFSYAHNAFLTEFFIKRGLKALGTDYADVLVLGYFPKRPGRRIIDGALRLKEKGLVRFLGISSHNRKLFPELLREGIFDVFHVRYNAAHRGAETEVFPYFAGAGRPGVVSFTATRWGQLLYPKKIPKGERQPSAADCYRYVLSHPAIDVCMVGARTLEQMRENLAALDKGPMNNAELLRMNRIGDSFRGKQ
jgi:aryl-alcohol dehydrogenase-like predicted oxidoreductase